MVGVHLDPFIALRKYLLPGPGQPDRHPDQAVPAGAQVSQSLDFWDFQFPACPLTGVSCFDNKIYNIKLSPRDYRTRQINNRKKNNTLVNRERRAHSAMTRSEVPNEELPDQRRQPWQARGTRPAPCLPWPAHVFVNDPLLKPPQLSCFLSGLRPTDTLHFHSCNGYS